MMTIEERAFKAYPIDEEFRKGFEELKENGVRKAWDYEVLEQDLPFPYGQKFYEEVLRRFRETKKEQA